MKPEQKKIAPRAATPETKSRKILSINSILKKGGEVKVVIKRVGEKPRTISAYDIPPEFLSRKLRCERLDRFILVYDPKSLERMNIAYAGTPYRGIVLIVNRGLYRLFDISDRDENKAVSWLLRHSV